MQYISSYPRGYSDKDVAHFIPMSFNVFKLPNPRSRLPKAKARMRRSGNWVICEGIFTDCCQIFSVPIIFQTAFLIESAPSDAKTTQSTSSE